MPKEAFGGKQWKSHTRRCRACTQNAGTVAARETPVETAAGAGTLVDKLARISRSLELNQAEAIPTAIRQANEMMGLMAIGTLPQQADALLAALGI